MRLRELDAQWLRGGCDAGKLAQSLANILSSSVPSTSIDTKSIAEALTMHPPSHVAANITQRSIQDGH